MEISVKYNLNVEDVSIERHHRTDKPTCIDFYFRPTCIDFYFDQPLIAPVGSMLINTYTLSVNAYMYPSYYKELSEEDAFELGISQIEKMLNYSITDEELDNIVMYFDGNKIVFLKDIDDKNFIKDFKKLLKTAIIDKQI